jgi:methyl-accepting chemotaxis protein
MFNKMRLCTRIALGYLIVLLFMVAIGINSISNLKSANQGLKTVYLDRVVPLKGLKVIADAYAVSIIDAVNKTNAGLMNAEDALQSIREADGVIKKEWHAYMNTELTPKEETLAAEAEKQFQPANDDIRRLEAALADKKGIIKGQLADFDGPLYTNIDPIGGKVTDLINLQLNVAEQVYESAAEDYQQTLNQTIAATATALIISFWIGFLLIRNLSRQLGGEPSAVADIANRMAVGDLSARIELRPGDKASVMAAMKDMVSAIQSLVKDMNELSKAAVAGRLAARADEERHQGDYRKIVEGVNATLDAVIGPLNVASDYLDNIAKGQIPAKLTDTYHGDFNTVKNNLNTCIDAINALIDDAGMLADAAVQGRLQTRAELSRHQGGFRKVVAGVNDTLDSIIVPLNETAEVLSLVERGDLTRTVGGHYQGQVADFKNTVNNTIAKLAQTISEVVSASEQLGNASSQISATSQSLSQASSEQAAGVEQTGASIEQMTANINKTAENAKTTDEMASGANREAIDGGSAVKQTLEAMKCIAGKIGIVDDIAYQTNMLALNAAIEAARAGDHGKGFAVVAAEVRKLAERSQVAAQEISQLAESSVDTAETAGRLLDGIVLSITKTSDLIQEMSAATQEQSSGVSQINLAMSQMNQVTQQNAAASEELAATAEQMTSQVEQLQSLMEFFNTGRLKVSADKSPVKIGVNRQNLKAAMPAIASVGKKFGRF